MASTPVGIHLCGSLPFDDGTQAFRWIGEELRPWVRRVPDETGPLAGWVQLQLPYFAQNPWLEQVPPPPDALIPMPQVRPRADVDPAAIRFERFAYADAAKASYLLFERARSGGTLPADAKFQVGLPSPLNPVALYVVPDAQAAVLPAYEAATSDALEEILDALPHADLCFQWDIPIEVMMWEGWLPNPLGGRAELTELLARIGGWIPADVELGYHLCFGDSDVQPHPYPDDAQSLGEVWNAIHDAVDRPIGFVHMPTSISWTEPRHYRPLVDLKLDPGTDLYLGVVHHQDGTAGGSRRAAAAASVLERPFGISTECGMGRYQAKESFRTCVDALRELAAG